MVYKPGLENKAAHALSRVPPTAHLNHISAPALVDLLVIKEEVEKDSHLKEIIAKLERNDGVPDFTIEQGIMRYKGRLVISKTSTLLPIILHTYHDSVFEGHSRYLKT